jgi:hypothetical protein
VPALRQSEPRHVVRRGVVVAGCRCVLASWLRRALVSGILGHLRQTIRDGDKGMYYLFISFGPTVCHVGVIDMFRRYMDAVCSPKTDGEMTAGIRLTALPVPTRGSASHCQAGDTLKGSEGTYATLATSAPKCINLFLT